MDNEENLQKFLEETRERRVHLNEKSKILLSSTSSFKTLEIGSGHGDFLVNYAQNFPERFCVGIDLISQRVLKSIKKSERLNLKNCSFIKARAEEFLEEQPASFFWNEVIILYPDPWPKRHHHKNRLLQSNFLSQLANRVVNGAKIHFETDNDEYFKEVCKCVTLHPNWQQVNDVSYKVDTFFSRITGNQGFHAVFENIR